MPARMPRRALTRAFSLIEILVVIVIMVALGAFLMNQYAGKSKPGDKRRTPMTKARDTECAEYLRQNRMAIQMQQQSDEESKFPASLSDLRLGQTLMQCPEGKELYLYDPATGQVHCPHPGHEKL